MTAQHNPGDILIDGLPSETIASAAARLGVSQWTVRQWIIQGRLAAYRFGRKLIRVKVTDVDALIRPLPTVKRASGQ